MAAKKTVISISDVDDLLDLKKPWLAALLSWFIPGAGQIYQGRVFKGMLFGICILGMFFCGVQMGEGRPVYCYYSNGANSYRNYGYISQFLVGLPALPALVQMKRYDSLNNTSDLEQPLDEPFEGVVLGGPQKHGTKVSGSLSLRTEPSPSGPVIQGQLLGKTSTGERIELELSQWNGGQIQDTALGRKIKADPRKAVTLEVTKIVTGPDDLGRNLEGSIPRELHNWYQVPLQDAQLQDMNGRLGKRWELAMVFTWIAGLLNILVIWDAYEGPAYGLQPMPIEPKDSDPPISAEAKLEKPVPDTKPDPSTEPKPVKQ